LRGCASGTRPSPRPARRAATADYLSEFDRDVTDLRGVLQTTSIMRSAAQTVRDLCSGYGELWSTRFFRRYLRGVATSAACNGSMPRRCVTVQWGPLGPGVQWQESRHKLRHCCRRRRRRRW